jgi:glycosyltransferase involved in cell wall biosynthesis
MPGPHILHISYTNKGGAGITAYRFHQLVQQAGYTSEMLLLKKDPTIQDSQVTDMSLSLWQRLKKKGQETALELFRKMRGITINPAYCFTGANEQFSFYDTKSLIKKVKRQPDIIVLHWLSGFVNAKNIAELAQHYQCPIVWRFNDMAPFTGGCHYTHGCLGYQSGCGNCPAIASQRSNDLSSQNIQFKKQYLQQIKLLFVASTTEIHEEISQSTIGQLSQIHKIFPAIDSSRFKFIGQPAAAAHFGLPTDKKIVLFVAGTFFEERKGFAEIVKLLAHLKELAPADLLATVAFVLVSSDTELPPTELALPYTKLGSMPPSELFQLYQASTVFVSASVQDGGPMTLCEAILAGTPALAYNIGIAKDIVQDGVTGHLIPLRNSLAMAQSLLALLQLAPDKAFELRKKTRFFAQDFFDPGKEISQYRKLFNSITNGTTQ